MKVLLITEQYIDIRKDGCYCNHALYGTLQNMNVLGELHIIASLLTKEKPSSQPLDQKIEFLSPLNVEFLQPTNRKLFDYLKNSHRNHQLFKRLIPSVDLIICYLPLANSVSILKIAKHHKVPFLSFLVACPWDALHNHHRFLARMMAPIRFFSVRYTIKHSDYVHYVTKVFLQQRYPTNGKSLGCSDVNLGVFDEMALENRLRKLESRRKTDLIRLVTTAHLDVRFKGQEYVIRAIAQMKHQGICNYSYEMIGNGEGAYLRNLCRQLKVEEQVKFLGRKTSEEVIEILQDADVYIQPSLQEGLPRAVVEAMSVALPCVGFRTGGIPELLEPKFIVDKKDVKGIINCLLKLENSEEYTLVAKRNFQEAKEYEHSKLVKQIRNFFLEIRESIELNNN